MSEVKDNSFVVVAVKIKTTKRPGYVWTEIGHVIGFMSRRSERLRALGDKYHDIMEYKPKVILKLVEATECEDGTVLAPDLTKIKSIGENTKWVHYIKWTYCYQPTSALYTLFRHPNKGANLYRINDLLKLIYCEKQNSVKGSEIYVVLTNLERSIKAQLKRKFPQFELKQIKDNETVRYELIKKEK